jgi:hypothetical protein
MERHGGQAAGTEKIPFFEFPEYSGILFPRGGAARLY